MTQTSKKGERIPSDRPGVFETLTTEQKLALVTPANPPAGIGGFLLDVIEEDAAELSSDITDHYVEKNFAIQDHIALRPETVTLHGIVSELAVLRTPTAETGAAKPQKDALPDNADLAPTFTDGAVQNKDAATTPQKKVANALTKYEDAYGKIGATVGKKQRDVYDYFYQLWKGRQFVSVETAWGIWPCMVIQNLRGEQTGASRFQSDFYVTFKAIRSASDVTVATKAMEPVAGNQSAAISDNGQGSKEQKPISWLERALTFNPFK